MYAVQQHLSKTQGQLTEQRVELDRLHQRLEHFEQENAANPDSIEARFRLDAGFSMYGNVVLLRARSGAS